MIDITKPLEAVHSDGRVVPMTFIMLDNYGNILTKENPEPKNSNRWWRIDGKDCRINSGWHLRNVKEPKMERTGLEHVEHMEALLRKMVTDCTSHSIPKHYEEARAIVAEIDKAKGPQTDEDFAAALVSEHCDGSVMEWVCRGIAKGRELAMSDLKEIKAKFASGGYVSKPHIAGSVR
jgi:hypothetical protein